MPVNWVTAVRVTLLCLAIGAGVLATSLWPPRCSSTPDARIASAILIAGCDRP